MFWRFYTVGFFFTGRKVRGKCIMSVWPPGALWLFLKTHMYSTHAAIRSPAGDEGVGSRDESLKIQKCHQPHRVDVNQGTLTGRQLNWLWRLLYHIKLHFAAWCHSRRKHNDLTRLETEQNQEASKPNYPILGTIQSALEMKERKIEQDLWNHKNRQRAPLRQNAMMQIHKMLTYCTYSTKIRSQHCQRFLHWSIFH